MTICIAAAQAPSVAGEVAANVATHVRFIEAAQAQGVDLLVFPELSLSGYEPALLAACALTPGDARLAPIRDAAISARMTVIAGAPQDGGGDGPPYIAAFAFAPDGTVDVYRKQYLHAGEEHYVQAGELGAHCRELNGHRYALAICADTTHRAHAAAAAQAGAALYLAGVLISKNGYQHDAALMQRYAADFGIGVLMANHAAPSGGYDVAGRSAMWAPGGALLACADGPGDCLVIARNNNGWQGRVMPL